MGASGFLGFLTKSTCPFSTLRLKKQSIANQVMNLVASKVDLLTNRTIMLPRRALMDSLEFISSLKTTHR